jgi:pilus assembly protein CpaF
MNTGHEGSLSTVHANSPEDALARLEVMVLMANVDLPSRAVREQLASAIDVVVQQGRLSDGSRKILAVSEVVGIDEGRVVLHPILEYKRTGTRADGAVEGRFRATGYLPTFLDDFIVRGLIRPGESFL